jgi:hypothetical protein
MHKHKGISSASKKGNVHLEGTRAEIVAAGGQAIALTCNIRNEEHVHDTIQAVLERFGRLDGLVNNAGGQFFSPAEKITARGWQNINPGRHFISLLKVKLKITNNHETDARLLCHPRRRSQCFNRGY